MANPISGEVRTPRKSAQQICDEGNLRLAGLAPYTCKKYAGQYHRRDDIRWVVRDGRPTLEWR